MGLEERLLCKCVGERGFIHLQEEWRERRMEDGGWILSATGAMGGTLGSRKLEAVGSEYVPLCGSGKMCSCRRRNRRSTLSSCGVMRPPAR